MKPKNVFVTGQPGVGKTTLIERVLHELDTDAGGFLTREIREDGARVGFSIRDLHGGEGVLAHVSLESPFRVGRYGVNRADLERVGVHAVERAVSGSTLIVMDEVGRMELCSGSFQAAVVGALDSMKPVLGTLQARSNAFLDSLRARPDVEEIVVTPPNRDRLVHVLCERMAELLKT